VIYMYALCHHAPEAAPLSLALGVVDHGSAGVLLRRLLEALLA
jgi:hypothetical protein